MKKIICLLLSLLLIAALAGCGEKDGGSSSDTGAGKTASGTVSGNPDSSSETDSSDTASSEDAAEEEEQEDPSPKVGDTLTSPEAKVDFNTCKAFYVDYTQTTYGLDYDFVIATRLDGETRTLYVKDKTVGDETVYVTDGKTLSCYQREDALTGFKAAFSGQYDAKEAAGFAESYEHICTELENFMDPSTPGYTFVKMNDTSTDFGPAFVYNQITDSTADGYVIIDKDTGIMVASTSHEENTHEMAVLELGFSADIIPSYK